MSDGRVDIDEVLKTEDGHPIGEIVIADNTALPPEPIEETIAANREEALRATAVELTRDPDADKAVAELYPGYGDADKRKLAMASYVVGQKPIAAIAAEVGVPERTVSRWAYDNQWDKLVREELAAKETQAKLELARLRAERRTQIVQEQLEQAKQLRDAAIEKMEHEEAGIKSATEAWAAAAKVEHTLTGLSEAGELASLDGGKKDDKKEGGKQPLVVVFQGGLPPIRRPQQ